MKGKNHRLSSSVLVHGLLMAAALLGFGGCDSNSPLQLEPIAVEGTWVIQGTWDSDGDHQNDDERYVIGDGQIRYDVALDGRNFTTPVYQAEIVSYSNNGLNAEDAEFVEGAAADGRNPGYAVIRYLYVDNPGTGEFGKYNIFRWADSNSDPSKKDFTQGTKNVGPPYPDNVNGVFETPEEAWIGATVANDYFLFASSGAEKP